MLRLGWSPVHLRGMTESKDFAAFARRKYLNLETFRKSGEGVRTPIWFAEDTSSGAITKLYCYTIGNTGKVKRIRNNPKVRIAPCDMRGKVLGEWMDARIEMVSGEEAAHGMAC